ncbi:MAG: universal stress protein, partial [Actinomycetota bacterium]
MKILVATDQSESANQAVQWAADMAARFDAELVLCQVLAPASEGDGEVDHQLTTESLRRLAEEMAGQRGSAHLVIDADPARGIVQSADDSGADVVVVGNLGMSGRSKFLLGNVPNRVSHNARQHVIIVNTSRPVVTDERKRSAPIPVMPSVIEEEDLEPPPHLLGRATQIGRVLAKQGFQELFTAAKAGDDAAVRE